MSRYGAIFDMDGVLVESGEAHFTAWATLGDEIGTPFDRAMFARTFGGHNNQIVPLWLGREVSQTEIDRLSQRKEVLYRALAPEFVKPLPGAVALVENLAAHGFELAVGSSGPLLNVRMVLQMLGIIDRFAVLSTGEDVTVGKPNPQVFQVAVDRLHLPAGRCVVLEDAVQGVQAALAAGCRVVAITSSRQRADLHAAHLVVDRLDVLDAARLQRLIDHPDRVLGRDAGKIWTSDDFDELPDDVLRAFEREQ